MEAYGLIDPPVQGGQIVVPSSSDFQTLNPALAADATSFQLVENMYEALVGDPADGTLIPGLCDYWELAEDGVTFTFHLPERPLARRPALHGEDVKFSYDTVVNPDINNSYRSHALAVTDSYRVVDQYTFEVKAKERLVTFLADSPAVVSRCRGTSGRTSRPTSGRATRQHRGGPGPRRRHRSVQVRQPADR